MKTALFRTLVSLAAMPLGLVVMATGCAKQGEGEVCDFGNNGHDDCESSLECARDSELVAEGADRCCPPEGEAVSDDRCRRGTGGGTGGSAGMSSGGAAGMSSGGTAGTSSGGTAGTSSGGTAGGGGAGGTAGCTHDSQCPGSQVCGPLGRCQAECLGNKDCDPGFECDTSTSTCVSSVVDAGTD